MSQAFCTKCGTGIQPVTFERTGGFCIPCKRLEPQPPAPKFDRKGFSIFYTVEPGWARPRQIYVVHGDDAEVRIVYQSQMCQPGQDASARHHIDPKDPIKERRLTPQEWGRLEHFK